MKYASQNEYEVFAVKVRWLAVLSAPVLVWFYTRSISYGLALGTLILILFNGFTGFYLSRKINTHDYSLLFSLIDAVYLTSIYVYTLPNLGGLPQLYYFLMLIMGIRHGMAKYYWIVLINVLLYVSSTGLGSCYNGLKIDQVILFTNIFFLISFGAMSSYILNRYYEQQLEKEELITELQAAYEQLCVYNIQVEELANTDPLTGLYNYRFFTERLEKEIKASKRYNRSLSLIIIDIDHFKDFNDTYGHPAGDVALKETSNIFKQKVRDKDVLSRYGGEEFLILLPSTGIEEAYKCAERIREAVQQHKIHIDEKHEDVSITISGGVACFPSDASTGEQLLRIADEVLYSAKHKGRNKIYRRL
ncbi:MAG: hypothetical protein CVV03_01525 [Firmicutes bacterium HGW-Firmicutes-8]|nr:MAG: hypothetical protein CVV03_01525 [Firmicutes bacterium HGW-Firmicutes-8]